jgi:hypothetical protein
VQLSGGPCRCELRHALNHLAQLLPKRGTRVRHSDAVCFRVLEERGRSMRVVESPPRAARVSEGKTDRRTLGSKPRFSAAAAGSFRSLLETRAWALIFLVDG